MFLISIATDVSMQRKDLRKTTSSALWPTSELKEERKWHSIKDYHDHRAHCQSLGLTGSRHLTSVQSLAGN